MSAIWDIMVSVKAPENWNAQDVQDFITEKGLSVVQITRKRKEKEE